MSDIIILILLLIPAIIWQNTMHELSHVIVAKLKHNCILRRFIPLWHWADLDDYHNSYHIWRPWELWKKPYKNSKWLFASNTFSFALDDHNRFGILFYIIPLLSAMTFSLLYIILTLHVHSFFVVLIITAIVDQITWVYGYCCGSEQSDGQQLRKILEC
jgi:hypothetical protein